MCLLVIAHQCASQLPLVVTANRDEFHARPTAASDFWVEHPYLLAGRDLEQGGTWMGITRQGRFAAVTNYRDPAGPPAAPRSRGDLPLDFLCGELQPQAYLNRLARRAGEYAGFNLLVGDRDSLWYYTNRSDAPPRKLPPGFYGLSNAQLDTPWPKVERGKETLRALLGDGVLTHEALAAVVSDRELADPESLAKLGLDGAMDPLLSAQFIVTDSYGTRSNTTLWIEKNGNAHWREQSFDCHGQTAHLTDQSFTLQA